MAKPNTDKMQQVQDALDAKYGKGAVTITRRDARAGFHGTAYYVTGELVDRVAPNRAHYDPKGVGLTSVGSNSVAAFIGEIEDVVASAQREAMRDTLDAEHREIGHEFSVDGCRVCAQEAHDARAAEALRTGRLAYALEKANAIARDLESIASDVRREIASFEAHPLDDPGYGESYVENLAVQILERVQQGVVNLRLGSLIQAAAYAGRETDKLRAEQHEASPE